MIRIQAKSKLCGAIGWLDNTVDSKQRNKKLSKCEFVERKKEKKRIVICHPQQCSLPYVRDDPCGLRPVKPVPIWSRYLSDRSSLPVCGKKTVMSSERQNLTEMFSYLSGEHSRRYHIEGDISAAYSEMVIKRICR
ncbi:uncharacterized protein LOC118478331 [Aplysia californica]|uniref:Uncharacterized protein LOC118478331 n=1 Tax=Aplysia californica TaxID=6500 RepID=A0ABM1VZ25_APLCA|nr:uncharacterized protein LOC118478331 [Aplysia californica]